MLRNNAQKIIKIKYFQKICIQISVFISLPWFNMTGKKPQRLQSSVHDFAAFI